MSETTFTPGEEFILHWQYGMLGGFRSRLVEAIAKADDGNLARLRLGFPDEVDAFLSYSRVSGWWGQLQERAKVQS